MHIKDTVVGILDRLRYFLFGTERYQVWSIDAGATSAFAPRPIPYRVYGSYVTRKEALMTLRDLRMGTIRREYRFVDTKDMPKGWVQVARRANTRRTRA